MLVRPGGNAGRIRLPGAELPKKSANLLGIDLCYDCAHWKLASRATISQLAIRLNSDPEYFVYAFPTREFGD